MKKRITVQDIANELGISRNTVSKAINGTGYVADETKNMIFKKAGELGYKQFGILQQTLNTTDKKTTNSEIALFTCSTPSSHPLSSVLLETFQKEAGALGYRLIIHMLNDKTVSSCTYPDFFDEHTVDAILVMELFDKAYTSFLCTSKIPTLFIDSYANYRHEKIASDIIYMENINSVYLLVSHMIESGCKKIGFIGDIFHCHSFYERWNGYTMALRDKGIDEYKHYCVLDTDSSPYMDSLWLADRLKAIQDFPDAFYCANDFLALCTIRALKSLGYSIPKDVKVAGFDNSDESKMIDPLLTTVTIHGKEMGHTAAHILLNRIKYPHLPYTTAYIQTDIVYRDSTER